MASQFVSSVKKENQSGYYRLLTIWSDEKTKIHIASENGAWTGEWTRDQIEEICKHINLKPDELIQESKEALTTIDGKPGFVYAVEDNQFVWKKVIDSDAGIKAKLGAVSLEPSSFQQTIQTMMDVALRSNKSLQQDLCLVKEEKVKAENRIDGLFAQLSECKNEKTEMDTTYLSQFQAILNAKKIKISELEQQIIMLKSGGGSIPKQRKKAPLKTTQDPYNADTDEDEPMPSTSKTAAERKTKERITGKTRSENKTFTAETNSRQEVQTDVSSTLIGRNKNSSFVIPETNSIDESVREPVPSTSDVLEVANVTSTFRDTQKSSEQNSVNSTATSSGNSLVNNSIDSVATSGVSLANNIIDSAVSSGNSLANNSIDFVATSDDAVVNDGASPSGGREMEEEQVSEVSSSGGNRKRKSASFDLKRTKPKDIAAFFFGGDSP